MPDVPKACDDFSRLLWRLRRERGMSSRALGEAIGKSADFIGGWERYPRPVNKEALHKVADALGVTDAERHQLFALADKRTGRESPVLGPPKLQALLNVHQALSEIPHELPEVWTDATAYRMMSDLGELGMLVLAHYAAGALGYSPDTCLWPEFIYARRIVHPKYRKDAKFTFPERLVHDYLPEGADFGELDKSRAVFLGESMAALLRVWLFSDLDRSRQAASGLKRWSLSDTPGIGPVVSFLYKDIDQQDFNVDRVRLAVALENVRRDFTGFVWDAASGLNENRQDFRWYPAPFGPIDTHAYAAFHLAKGYLADGQGASAIMLQSIRDSLFTVRSSAWRSVHAIRGLVPLIYQSRIHDEFESVEPETIAALETMSTDDLLEYQPMFESLQRTMLDKLEPAERKMSREIEPSERTGLPGRRPHAAGREVDRKPRKQQGKRKHR